MRHLTCSVIDHVIVMHNVMHGREWTCAACPLQTQAAWWYPWSASLEPSLLQDNHQQVWQGCHETSCWELQQQLQFRSDMHVPCCIGSVSGVLSGAAAQVLARHIYNPCHLHSWDAQYYYGILHGLQQYVCVNCVLVFQTGSDLSHHLTHFFLYGECLQCPEHAAAATHLPESGT
jgi:hypothetical protein